MDEALSGMSPDQHLKPEPVYRLNSELEEIIPSQIRGLLSAGGASYLVTVVDRRNRAINWVSVKDTAWRAPSEGKLEAQAGAIESHRAALEASGRTDANKLVTRVLRGAGEAGKGDDSVTADELIAAMASFPVRFRLLADGLLIRGLEDRAASGGNAVGQLSLTPLQGGCYRYPWMDASFDGDAARKMCQESEDESLEYPQKPPYPVPGFDVQDQLLNHLGPTFQPETITILPLYDCYLDGEAHGRLVGSVQVLWPGQPDEGLLVGIAGAISKGRDRILAALRSAARTSIARAPVECDGQLDDPILHFVREVVHLQDLERVSVLKDGRPQLCFVRGNADQHGVHPWERCNRCQVVSNCKWRDGDGNQRTDTVEELDHSLALDVDTVARRAFLKQFAGVVFEFQHPRYSVLPKQGSDERKRLRRYYLREQLDVWRLVIPKVLEARADQTRREKAKETAAVAIIARNLSHNIGSHVLSRLADETYYESATARDTGGLWTRGLFTHLRERMDLLAELATSSPTWSLPSDLWSLLERFKDKKLLLDTLVRSHGHGVLAHDNDRVRRQAEKVIQIVLPPLDQRSPCPVDLPLGVLGEQAVFAILENIVRNTAKHGQCGEVTLTLSAHGDGGLVKLRIQDSSQIESERLEGIKEALKKGFYKDADCTEPEPDGWGFKEMKMMAAFLRGRHAAVGEEYLPASGEDSGVPWVSADKSAEGNLILTFAFFSPRWLAVVGDGKQAKELEPFGVRAFEATEASAPAELAAYKVESGSLPEHWKRGAPIRRSERNAGWCQTEPTDETAARLVCQALSEWRRSLKDGVKVVLAEDEQELRSACGTWEASGVIIVPRTKKLLPVIDGAADTWDAQILDFDQLKDGAAAWYARHGLVEGLGSHADDPNRSLERLLGYWKEGRLLHFESFEMGSSIHLMWHHTKPAWAGVMAELAAEAALVPVVVFDDRLAEWLGAAKPRDRNQLQLAGIHIVKKRDWTSLDWLDPRVIEEMIGRNVIGKLAVCVHQSLLDVVWGSPTDEDLASRFRAWRGEIDNKHSGALMFVHTGRGVPRLARLCEDVRPLGYSNLERHIRLDRNKVALVGTLMAAGAGL